MENWRVSSSRVNINLKIVAQILFKSLKDAGVNGFAFSYPTVVISWAPYELTDWEIFQMLWKHNPIHSVKHVSHYSATGYLLNNQHPREASMCQIQLRSKMVREQCWISILHLTWASSIDIFHPPICLPKCHHYINIFYAFHSNDKLFCSRSARFSMRETHSPLPANQ